jgi:hypothetical protein
VSVRSAYESDVTLGIRHFVAEHGQTVNNSYSNVAMKEHTQNRTHVLATRGEVCPRTERPRPRGEAESSDPRRICAAGSIPWAHRRRRGGGAQLAQLSLLRLALADAVPAIGRNIRRPAQRKPDPTYWLAGPDGLLGRAAADLLEHQVAREHAAVRLPVLVGDGQPEFAQSHASTLSENRVEKNDTERRNAPGLTRGAS